MRGLFLRCLLVGDGRSSRGNKTERLRRRRKITTVIRLCRLQDGAAVLSADIILEWLSIRTVLFSNDVRKVRAGTAMGHLPCVGGLLA